MIPQTIRQPPSIVTGELGKWLSDVAGAINNTPRLSFFSGDTPESVLTGRVGNLAVNVVSGDTATRLWTKGGDPAQAPNTTGWLRLGGSSNGTVGTSSNTLTQESGNTITAVSPAFVVNALTASSVQNQPSWVQTQAMNISGNAATATLAASATVLATTRTIWGQNFNGSANVTGAFSGATTINHTGTQTSTIVAGDYYHLVPATQATSSPWRASRQAFANTDDPLRDNNVVRFGWNLSSGGGAFDPADWAFGTEYEQYYAPSAGIRAAEWHITFVNSSSVIVARPITVFMNRTGPYVDVGFQADLVYAKDLNDDHYFDLTSAALALGSGGFDTKLRFEANDFVAIDQLNAAGTGYINMIWVDSADKIQVGGGVGVAIGPLTLSAALTYGGVTLSNAVTGTGNMVLSASPTLTGTITVSGATITGLTAASVGSGTFPSGTYGFTGATTLTGGAGNMTVVAGTGASRTLILQATSSGSSATTNVTLTDTTAVWNSIAHSGITTVTLSARLISATSYGGTVLSATAMEVYANSFSGATLAGYGTNYDVMIANKNASNVMGVLTGTQNVEFFGTIVTAGQITSGAGIQTSPPTGGAGVWELGIANAVSPTSPNRTITVEIGGTAYYLAAKTTND